MTTLCFLYAGNTIVGFDFSGHAMMGGSGRDILCAAISSAAYLAANTITDVIGVKADITVGHGHMRVIVPEDSGQQCDWLLRGLKLHMKELYKQYPNKIKITLRKVQHNA